MPIPQPTKRKRAPAETASAIQLPRTRINDVKHKWSSFESQAARRGIVQGLTFQEYSVLVNMPCTYCGHGACATGATEAPKRLVGVGQSTLLLDQLRPVLLHVPWACNRCGRTYLRQRIWAVRHREANTCVSGRMWRTSRGRLHLPSAAVVAPPPPPTLH